MQQFYLSSLSKNDTEIHFDKNESKHMSRVLRKKVGDPITITNGLGYRFSATLSHVDQKACTGCHLPMRKIPGCIAHLAR